MKIMLRSRYKKTLLNPSSLTIHVLGIGAAVWLGKAWGKKTTDNY